MAFTENGKEISPTDYTIDSLMIKNSNTDIDVTYLLLELNINESLFQNSITGSLLVHDSLNIISNLPLLEGDHLVGKFKRNDIDIYIRDFDPDYILEFEFEIIKIREQEKTKQDQQIWKISFASPTWGDNLGRRVSKSYRQLPYSDMITDIYNTHLTRGGISNKIEAKPLEVVSTEGLWNIIIPNWKPFYAISILKNRSFKGDIVNYLFYEDKEKYYFKPMNDLMAEGPKAKYFTSVAETYDGEVSKLVDKKVLEPQYNRVLSFKMQDYHDVSYAALNGMHNTRLIKHDIFNKRITDYYAFGPEGENYIIDDPYDYFDDFGKIEHVDPGGVEMIKDTTSTKFSYDGDNVLSVYPEHFFQWDDQEQFKPNKWLRQRNGQMHQNEFIKFQMITPGNFTRKVGDKIEIQILSPQWKPKGADEKPIFDSKFQGNYMITSLRRKFTADTYTNVIEVIKDDYFSLITDDIWNRAKSPLKFDGHGNIRGL